MSASSPAYMDKLDDYLIRLRDGPGLTRLECMHLVAVAKAAAQFTEAIDRGDDYNRTKDVMFGVVRALMGWPARPARYPAEDGDGPHPFAQEGTW